MAWIKLVTTLPRSAKLMAFAQVLRMKRREALGVACDWFCWMDVQCANGCTGMLPQQVDEVMDCKRLAEALQAVGWAYVGTDGFLWVTDWEQHNGEGAKTRALNAVRNARYKAGKGDAGCVSEVTLSPSPNASPRYRDNKGNNMGDGLSNALSAPSAVPAPPALSDDEEGFRVWLAAVCAAHPSARRSRVLAKDVEEAAREAWMRCPEAAGHAELLAAYFASKLQEDRRGVKFYRPTGQRKFFENLEDVLAAAQDRWARDAHWKPQGAGPSSPERRTLSGYAEATSLRSSGKSVAVKPATAQEKEEFLGFLRGEEDGRSDVEGGGHG